MLQLVLGRSGFGKTEYVFNSIKTLVKNGEEAILITPEQYSFIAERRLLKELGEADVHKVQSLSFSRLNDEAKHLYDCSSKPVLSKGAKAVMMQRAALSVKDSLILYAKNVNQPSFINSFSSVYDEMKSCRVEVEDIIEASKNASNDGKRILSDKLSDISTLISAYDNLIKDDFLDSADELTRLYELLQNKNFFVNKTVFIDGFSGFVAQEYKIIEVILKQAKKTYITLCNEDESISRTDDLFYYVTKNYDILKSVSKEANIEFLPPIRLTENHRSSNDLKLLEQSIYRNKKTNNTSTDTIKIYSAKNIYDECDHTAGQIVKLLRKGYKASDITVICRDLDKYKRELEFSFEKYNVPYYNDERQNICNEPIIVFVCFLLRCAMYSKRSEDIFSLLKTGLTGLDDNSVSALENYVYLWSISGSKWNKEFVGSTKGFVDEITADDKKQIDELNTSREYIISRLNKFISSAKEKCCKDICKAIYRAIIDFGCDDGLRRLAIELNKNGKSSLAEEQGRVWDLLMQILDKLALVGGDETITIKEFYKLFNLMISNEDLGVIPTGLDNIQIGSADRIRTDNPKVVFILGANEGKFPQAVSSHGLFTEEDRIALISNDFKLYSYSEILNAQEKYFAYMAMTSASDLLYTSYINSEPASSIISQIKDTFSNIKVDTYNDDISIDDIESTANAFEILSSRYNENTTFVASLNEYFRGVDCYSYRLNAVKGLTENSEIRINDKQIATDLFKKDMTLSASRIDVFYDCSFEYFCRYGIYAKPRQKAEMNPMQTGTVIHYVLENLIKDTGAGGLREMSNEDISHLVNSYLNQFLDSIVEQSEEFTPRLKYQFMRLSKILVRIVLHLKEEFEHSDFEPKAFELEIGENAPVKSKTIQLDDGGSIKITGAIDRVDTYKNGDKQYVRVVDYKTGNKTFNLNHILYGINLQMFIYLFTLCQSNSDLSGINAGVLYLKSGRNVINYTNKVDSSAVEKDEGKDFKMIGLVLNDDENPVAEHMEHNLEGKYIPVSIDSKNNVKGDFASLEELGRISNKIDKLIAEMGTRLHNGEIQQKPIKITSHRFPCEFCDYKTVCMNRTEITPYEPETYNKADVLNMLKEDDDNA